MRYFELARDRLIDRPRRPSRRAFRYANLTDLRAEEDSSDEEDWEAAQRRIDEELAEEMIEPPESFNGPSAQSYVPFEPGMTSLDNEIVEQPEMSETRYVRESGPAGLAHHERRGRGRGK